ncbi:MAG: hypothetical protein ACLGSA_07095 [Acidobacteriota bacterium]
MRPSSILALAVALMLIVGPTGLAFAKKSGGGGSFSSGGSRSGSSGWSSSSRPGTPPPAPSSPSPSGGTSGWSSSKPAAPSQPTQPGQPGAPAQSSPASPGGFSNSGGASSGTASRSAGTSAFSSSGADAAKRQAATTSYQGYQGLYSKSGNAVPGQVGTNKPILNQNRTFGSYQEYNGYRDNYYAGRGYSAPGYAFNSFSRFGMWDAMFMWFMLSNMTSGAGFFHNNQNDPGVKAFKEEAAKLSESNADLKKQLDEMNAKLDSMKKDGVPVEPGSVPKDVDPNIALAEPKIDDSKGDSGKSSGGLFWPLATMAVLGGGALWMFNRRRG